MSFPALALALTLAVVLGACSRSSGTGAAKDPFAQLIAHTDRMIQILEVDREDPARAAHELSAYQEKHAAEIERLKQAASELMQKDPMRVAGASSLYGMKSAELEGRIAELAALRKSGAQ